MEKRTLLGCMNSLLEILGNSSKHDCLNFSEDRLCEVKDETDYLNEKLGLTPIQSVLFSAIMQNSTANCNMEQLAQYLGITYVKLLTYTPDINVLWDKWLIRKRGMEVRVPDEVTEQISLNKPYSRPDTRGLTTRNILSRFSRLFRLLRDDSITDVNAMLEMDKMIMDNTKTSIGKALNKYADTDGTNDVPFSERFLLYLLVHLYANKKMDNPDWEVISMYFNFETLLSCLREQFEDGRLYLQSKGVFEYACLDGMTTKDSIHLNDSLMSEILADEGGLHKSSNLLFSVNPDSIVEKRLFYNDAEMRQINTLAELLSKEKLDKVFAEMKGKGLKTGFTCLFYGAPGTGKTETVYQLAKKTGRKIIMADVSKLKSCYVGESEKNVRAFFYDYKIACRENDVLPILLFNEADALFGIRKEQATNSVDKMENSIQNIILQEMEDLHGVLIATTNLTQNLDKAFERRFLYKIKFEKPSEQAMVKIWQSMIPEISTVQAVELSARFGFSGGQIENVVRKKTVQSVLFGADFSMENMLRLCSEEQLGANNRNWQRIGY